MRGETVIDAALATDALTAGPSPLTPREAEVLAAARGGGTIADVALDPASFRGHDEESSLVCDAETRGAYQGRCGAHRGGTRLAAVKVARLLTSIPYTRLHVRRLPCVVAPETPVPRRDPPTPDHRGRHPVLGLALIGVVTTTAMHALSGSAKPKASAARVTPTRSRLRSHLPSAAEDGGRPRQGVRRLLPGRRDHAGSDAADRGRAVHRPADPGARRIRVRRLVPDARRLHRPRCRPTG